jgi:NAD(P)H-quinone oxidoreductase subunit 5
VMVHSPTVLNTLALIGSFTALFASLIMLTQTSIKRSLAYSTIAQMGFMMLQIGLGAFALAMLHIVAHSLYKAHAFLTSGSIVNLAKSAWTPSERPAAHPLLLIAILLTSVILTFGMALVFGVQWKKEPGVLVLGSVYLMGLTYFFWNLWASSHRTKLIMRGLLIGLLASAAYFGLHIAFVHMMTGVLPTVQSSHSLIENAVFAIILLLFLAVLVVQAQFPQWSSTRLGRALYVHAYKGFYFVTLANRITLALTPRTKLESSKTVPTV